MTISLHDAIQIKSLILLFPNLNPTFSMKNIKYALVGEEDRILVSLRPLASKPIENAYSDVGDSTQGSYRVSCSLAQ